MNEITQPLKEALQRHKMPAYQFARIAGVTAPTIGNLLRGMECTTRTLRQVKAALYELQKRDIPADSAAAAGSRE